MITLHVVANAEIHQHAPTHTSMTHSLVNVSASLTHVQIISTSITIPAVVAVVKIQPVPATNTSMTHPANATAVMSLNVAQENTTTMTLVIACARIHRLAMLLTTMTQIPASVSVDHMIATLVNTLTPRPVAASAPSTRPAQTISTSMKHLANVNVK